MNEKTKKFVIIGTVVLSVVIVVVLFFTGSLQQDDDSFMGKTGAPSSGVQEYSSANSEGYLNNETDIPYETLLEDYTEWSQYPPDSRPLKPSYVDQIEYYWIPVHPRKMLIPGENENENEDEELSYQHECGLQPLKKDVVEGEKMVVELHCYRSSDNNDKNVLVPAKIEDFTIERSFDTKRWKIPKTAVTELVSNIKKNRYIYRWEYTPQRSDWGNIRFNVSFLLPAEKKGKFVSHEMFADFFSSPVAPAKFTGNVRDVVENGSLIIYAELNVKITGDYTIEANLYNKDGPIAYARTPGGTVTFDTKGLHETKLQFFGKVLHDQDAEGPYRAVGLRGVQSNLAISANDLSVLSKEEIEQKLATTVSREPDRRVMPTLASEHVTALYTLEDFSETAYDSERKRAKIDYYKGQIKRSHKSE